MPSDPKPTAPPTAAVAHEVELKLQLDPADLRRVVALPLLRERAEGPATTRRLRTVYYDTADRRLLERGVALRVRHEGDRHVQGLKTMDAGQAGDSAAIAVRREWEWPLAGAEPDLRLLAEDGAAALVPEDARGDLRPIFETDVLRTAVLLRPDPLTVVEIAVDEGAVTAGHRCQAISEVELELKSGRVGRLFDLALELQRAVPVRIATESKAELGYRLVTGRRPGPAAEEPVALSPLATVGDAFRHIVRHALRQLLANEACALADADAEGVHRIRIALRRLRVALRLFRDVIASDEAPRLRRDARWLSDRLRPLRRWDVVLTGAVAPLAGAGDSPAGLAALEAAVREARDGPAAAAVAALRSARCSGLVLALGAWLEEGRWHADAGAPARALLDRPATELARPWLDAHHARARRAGKAAASAAARERLRRRLRRLRYAVAFFRGLYAPGAVRAYAEALDAVLVALDVQHDADLARRLLARLAPSGPAADAAGAALRRLEREAARRRKAFPALWKEFRDAPVFWT
ncbi:CYTH and CHAD domain-containing protein [Azospirillum sp. A39]|uniref:CYTH and CHAD domain-containing protein n=1 Tax=Azospirillum sp. A39 TaxID=3462279 RepID=UPI0040463EAF